jgi:hypothetical protein
MVMLLIPGIADISCPPESVRCRTRITDLVNVATTAAQAALRR